jgi:ATP-binding cassette, subfamily B, bacterial
MSKSTSPVARLWALVQEKKSDISAIYFYSALSGLVQLAVPVGIQAIIGFVLGGTLATSLIVLIIIIALAVLFSGILQINQMKVTERIQQRIFVKYSIAFATHIPKLDLRKVDAYYLPELVNRFFDTTSLQKSISKILLDLPSAFIQILFGLILLCFYHPFFIFFSILLLALVWLILQLTGKKGLKSSLAKSTYKYQVAGWFEEMGRLVRTFKFSSPLGLHIEKADKKVINYLKARTEYFNVLLLQYKALIAFKFITTTAMLIVGVWLLLEQQINIGQFVATEIIIIAVMNAVEKIIIDLDNVYDTLTAMEKLSQVTDSPAEISGNYLLNDSNGISIEAKALSHSYANKVNAISDVSFTLKTGEKACVVGLEGSGKTTLLKLLTGIYPDFEGSLLINKIPLRNYNLDSLRSKMGILFPQENIFDGTLWENITMARDNIDNSYVTTLVEATGLQTFVATLANGYDTQLDPTGRKLPRNVINKILLIRVLVHKPKLIIMEEPWMNIEEHYRQNIQNLLLNLKDATLIVVTNDANFRQQCNHTISLKPHYHA